jgi:signal transduction histidine kinase
MSFLSNTSDAGSAGSTAMLRECDFSPDLDGSLVEPRPISDARSRAIALITHELRNSLGVVRNAARLLLLPLAADRVDNARTLIDRHVGQMSRHVQELLDAAQSGERSKGLRPAYVDLRVIAGYAVEAIATDLARRGHRLTVSLPHEALFVHVDAARLEQVFTNLLINAAKYTPAGGDISLTMELEEQQVCVRIRDSGIGIMPALIPRIFELYMQVDAQTPRAEGGRGIGLAVVRELVELHGGTVRAESAGLGLGSEFIVRLPAHWAASTGESAARSRRLEP